MALSKQQVEQFHQDGFVDPIPIVPPEEMRELSEQLFRDSTEETAASRYTYGFHSNRDLHLTSKATFRLVTHPNLISCLTQLLGPNVLLWRSAAIYKPPAGGDSSVPIQFKSFDWHQGVDFTANDDQESRSCTAVGRSRQDNLNNMPLSVSCWMAIDDVTEDNGALLFVPGSQRMGALPYITYKELAAKLNIDKAVLLRIPRGWGVLFDNLVFHKSIPNRSEKRRLGVSLRYVANKTPVYPRGDPKGYDLERWGCIQVAGLDEAGVNKIVGCEQLKLS